MSKLDRLIAKHCPNGVEFVPLGNVCLPTSNIRFTLENSHHNRNQNDIVTSNESLPIRNR
jgi:hypothetical protein